MLRQAPRTTARIFQYQYRSLASAVLLPKTPEQWQEHTVAELRTEAKRRGLTMGGNKTTLIEKLVAHSQTNERPLVPGIAGNPPPPVAAIRQRWISSGSYLQAESSTDKFKPRRSRTLDVKLPEAPEEIEEGPVIPFLAQNFDSPASKSASPFQEFPSNAPRVVTVASASTHIDGGPSHAIHEATDAYALESTGGDRGSSNIQGMLKELGIPLNVNFKGSTGNVINEILQPLKSSISIPAIKEDASSVKHAMRELNEEESRGLWVLGGIVFGGLVLGSFGNKKSTFRENH